MENSNKVRADSEAFLHMGDNTTHRSDEFISVVSVDAWADGAGWTWNNWVRIGKIPASTPHEHG